MDDFFRFPHTPHLQWLGDGVPRGDKVLSTAAANQILSGPVLLEEKLDGANLGLSYSSDGQMRVQNRGQYLIPPYTGQFSRLSSWLAPKQGELAGSLGHTLILFGEWCAARHSLGYERLPDWFIVFDIFDRDEGRFWSTCRRDNFSAKLGLATVHNLLRGKVTTEKLKSMVEECPSGYRKGPMEGIVIRKESEKWLEDRAKVVRAGFTQAITEHWSRRSLVWNQINSSTLR